MAPTTTTTPMPVKKIFFIMIDSGRDFPASNLTGIRLLVLTIA
jgi:hypothetical protein